MQTISVLNIFLFLSVIVSAVPTPVPIPEGNPNTGSLETSTDHNIDLIEKTPNLEARSIEVHTSFYDGSFFEDMIISTVWYSNGCNHQPHWAYRLSSLRVGNGCCWFYSDTSCHEPMWRTCNGGAVSLPDEWDDKMVSFRCYNPL